ncbi:MAG: hypothetical protein AB7F74_01560, partial [Parvibaculaceae bacterium]
RMRTMSSKGRAKMFLAIAKQHFALSSCRRRYEALGQMASGDGDNKLEHFRGERAKQKASGTRHQIRGARLAVCPAAGVGVDDRQ